MNRKLYIQATSEQELLFCFSEMEILSPNNCGDFWQLWLSYQDDFYNLCRKWMGGNCHDAEDALNQAMLKAWNEWKKSANKITYPKAWLTTGGRVLVEHFQEIERGCQVSEQGTQLQPQLADAWFRHGRVLALAGKHHITTVRYPNCGGCHIQLSCPIMG